MRHDGPAGILVLAAVAFAGVGVAASPVTDEDTELKTRQTVERLARALASKDPAVRYTAAFRLGHYHEKAASAIPGLISVLNQEVPVPGTENVIATWVLDTVRGSYTIYGRPKYSIGWAAADSLAEIGKPAVAPLVRVLPEIRDPVGRKNARRALGGIRDAGAVPALIDALRHKSSLVRVAATAALVGSAEPSVLEPLVAAMKDESPYVRGGVARALAELESPVTVAALAEALKDQAPSVRLCAVESLISLAEAGRADAIGSLISAVANTDVKVRLAAIFRLGLLRADGASEAMIDRLVNDSDSRVRAEAAIAIGLIGGRRGAEALLGAVHDDDPRVRGAVLNSLGLCVTTGVMERNDFVALVAAFLRDKAPNVRYKAAEVLASYGDRRALGPLLRHLTARNRDRRMYAARALGKLGNRDAIEPLIRALRDRDVFVQDKVADALKQLTGKRFGRNAKAWQKWWQREGRFTTTNEQNPAAR